MIKVCRFIVFKIHCHAARAFSRWRSLNIWASVILGDIFTYLVLIIVFI